MKKKLSLFMIATAAVVGLSLATPENQTVSANAQTPAVQNCENGCCDRPFFGYCGPFSWLYYIIQDIFWGILIQLLTNKFVSIVRQKPKPVYAVLGFFAVLKSGCCHSFKSKNN
ncbi:TPA: SpoV family signaling peptide [Streptococcus pyogenes]